MEVNVRVEQFLPVQRNPVRQSYEADVSALALDPIACVIDS